MSSSSDDAKLLRRLTKRFKPKPRAFIIFTDLDGTFTPIGLEGLKDFAQVVQEITERENVQVKFVPVSGRPCGYVLRVLHSVRDVLKDYNIDNVTDRGVAEQGAMLVDSARSYGPQFTGDPANVGLKARVGKALQTNEYRDIISDEPDKLYTCSIHIKNEAKAGMSLEDKFRVYRSAKADIDREFEGETDKLFVAMAHNCMEVMSSEISKANGLNMILHDYRRDYDIAGLMYGGDAENDKVAMTFVSKMAEVPGVNCHNFTPANAQEAISTHVLEKWKRSNRAAHQHFVERGSKKNFLGVTELIRAYMDKGLLCGMGVEFWRSRDDSDRRHQHDRYFDYHWPKLRRTRSLERMYAIAEHDPRFYGLPFDG